MDFDLPFLSLSLNLFETPLIPLKIRQSNPVFDCGAYSLSWKSAKGMFVLKSRETEIPLRIDYNPHLLLWLVLNFFWTIGKIQSYSKEE